MMLPVPLASSAAAWKSLGVPLANHVWQSTLFASLAGLLTLALKRNRAHARYGVWLAASVKFLLPFSLMIGVGSLLGRPRNSATAQPAWTLVVEQISQPFRSPNSTYTAAPPPLTFAAWASHLLPIVVLLVWFAGSAAVLFAWWSRWRRVRRALRQDMAVNSGRALEAQRRVSRHEELARPIRLFLSASALEPGIVGIFRPVMLLPAGISERLTDVQLDAILMHELCHVRRRDNLAALIHMLVEAIFWFHPLVWWIGARLVDERERACDEEVLRLGSKPQDYAEGILKVCEFYLESPLVCLAGVTGSNLKKRIEEIMRSRVPRKLDFGRKLLLAAAGVAVVTIPLAIGFANPLPRRAQAPSTTVAPLTSDGVSIKPHPAGDRLSLVGPRSEGWGFTGFTLKQLIAYAYGIHDFQISGGPAWLTSQKYDISLKLDASASSRPSFPLGPPPQFLLKVQNLLTDEFGLIFHRETKDLPVYAMVVGQEGPRMTEVLVNPQAIEREPPAPAPAVPSPLAVPATLPPGTMWVRMTEHNGTAQGQLLAKAVSMDVLAHSLSGMVGSKVEDRTGLSGTYDFTLSWSGDPASREELGDAPSPASVASVLMAVSQQLGLELQRQMGPVEIFVVDKAEEIGGNQSPSPAPAN
jgi:bla regulator protein blaR1